MDVEDLPAGNDWDTSIQTGLEASRAMVLIASDEAFNSREVMNEVGYALSNRLMLIPFVIRDCTRFPYRINRNQRIDARTDFEGALRTLLNRLVE